MYDIYSNGTEFKVDNELKQEYLGNKPTNTAESDSFILKTADEYEDDMKKSMYDMTYNELKGLILIFKNSSEKTVLKNVSVLKTYIDFCINRNVVLHGENRLATFSAKDAKDFVNRQAFLGRYFTKKQIREYEDMLFNEQDKLFIELLFAGGRGRTTEDGTFEELINLRMSNVDEEDKILTLTKNDGSPPRLLKVDDYTIELIKDTYNQEIYIENNGEMTENLRLSEPRKMRINKIEDYVFRVPSKSKYQIFSSNLINSRMRRIKIYLGLPYLTATSIYMSGMLNMALEIYKEKGEVTTDDYIEICTRYDYGLNGDFKKYWFNLKNLFEQYKEVHGIK